MDMRVWSPAFAGAEAPEPPARRVLVSMRDHALRRIVANVLRADGMDAVEAFDEVSTREELRRRGERRIEAVLVDARRYPSATLAALETLRARDPTLALIVLVTRRDESLVTAARAIDADVFQLPMTCRDLRATLDRAAHAASWSVIAPMPAI